MDVPKRRFLAVDDLVLAGFFRQNTCNAFQMWRQRKEATTNTKRAQFPARSVPGLALIVNLLAITVALGGCNRATETETGPGNTSGPGGVPVAPNASLITARVISITTNETGTFVELEVIDSQPIPGYLDFGANIVGEQVTARLIDDTTDPSHLIDETITGQLRYAGGEHGGIYLLSQVNAK
jgi:hypothetical protein